MNTFFLKHIQEIKQSMIQKHKHNKMCMVVNKITKTEYLKKLKKNWQSPKAVI